MRFYNIIITDTNGKNVFATSLGGLGLTSLMPNGQANMAALGIEFDIPMAPFHTPAGMAWVRIWGLGLEDIGAAQKLAGMSIQVFGGMSKGLPLANPSQARLLIQGGIQQAYGNWLYTSQTVDLIVSPAVGLIQTPFNHVLNWKAGTTLETALKSVFSVVYPKAKLDIKINPKLVLNHDEVGFYATLEQFAMAVNTLSVSTITTPGYPGVIISYDGSVMKVTDLSTVPTPITIAVQDIIGQPTWINPGTIQVKFVLRGDLEIGDQIILPATLATTAQNTTGYQGANRLTFSGKFSITNIHHYGNSRQPDALSWNTTVEAFPVANSTPTQQTIARNPNENVGGVAPGPGRA